MRPPPAALRGLGAAAGAGLALGLLEAQRVECRTLELQVPGLPPTLDGLRVLHLSDFHLGSLSLNGRALRKAVGWARRQEVDLVAVTGDLLARERGEADLRSALRALRPRHGTYVVLGNHDVAVTRDPFSGVREVGSLVEEGAVVLRDAAETVVVRGARITVGGVDPLTFLRGRVRPERLGGSDAADLRLLLCHFPTVVELLPPGRFQLVLAGHMHGGQICVPLPGRKLRLGGFAFFPPYPEGVFSLGGTVLVVSRGTGTAFVPFRCFSRPEAALLVLRPASPPAGEAGAGRGHA